MALRIDIIDRREQNKGASIPNRRRFIKKFKKQIKKALDKKLLKRSVTDITSGETVWISADDMSEPKFSYSPDGDYEIVLPGNKKYSKGDKIPKPKKRKGKKNKASNRGEGEDSFVFEISKDEFFDICFGDLSLPNMTKKDTQDSLTFKTKRAGHCSFGSEANLNIERSLKKSMLRRSALKAPKLKKLQELEDLLERLKQEDKMQEAKKIEEEIAELKRRISKIPFIDVFDLRYNRKERYPIPESKALMICIMDVSGSMGEDKKTTAKKFFILLYWFLKKNYKNVKILYILHHTLAKEAEEEEFFYSRETGGTVVSNALVLARDIIKQRYANQNWNIYIAQVSDGDNWSDDNPKTYQVLKSGLMPFLQYYFYLQIQDDESEDTNLWQTYKSLAEDLENFKMQKTTPEKDILEPFRSFFSAKKSKGGQDR